MKASDSSSSQAMQLEKKTRLKTRFECMTVRFIKRLSETFNRLSETFKTLHESMKFYEQDKYFMEKMKYLNKGRNKNNN